MGYHLTGRFPHDRVPAPASPGVPGPASAISSENQAEPSASPCHLVLPESLSCSSLFLEFPLGITPRVQRVRILWTRPARHASEFRIGAAEKTVPSRVAVYLRGSFQGPERTS